MIRIRKPVVRFRGSGSGSRIRVNLALLWSHILGSLDSGGRCCRPVQSTQGRGGTRGGLLQGRGHAPGTVTAKRTCLVFRRQPKNLSIWFWLPWHFTSIFRPSLNTFLRIWDVNLGSWFFSIPDPTTTKRGENPDLLPYRFCSQKFKIFKLILFFNKSTEQIRVNCQRIYVFFNPNSLH